MILVRDIPNRERRIVDADRFLLDLEKLATHRGMVKIKSHGGKRNTYNILSKNLQSLLQFSRFKISNDGVKSSTMQKAVGFLIYFANHVGNKSFKKVSRKDIELFFDKRRMNGDSEGTLSLFRIWIRSFFQWYYQYDDGYPEVVSWIKLKIPKNKKSRDSIEKDDIVKMLQACDNPRDKVLISILYESGARISELLDLKMKDATLDDCGFLLSVNGKTGERKIRIVQATTDLKNWIDNHAFKNKDEAPLFYSFDDKNFGGFMTGTSVWLLIRKLTARTGIKKNIGCHSFRHARATELSKVMSDAEMKIFFGWSRNSNMPGLYSHLDEKHVDRKIQEINGLKPKGEVKPMELPTFECYRCKEINNAGNKYCYKCGAPLDLQTIQKLDSLKNMLSEGTLKVLEEMADKGMDGSDLQEIIKGYAKSDKN